MRRGYLDWIRGVAVVVMIEGHVVDSWTRDADRASDIYGWATIVGGLGAPLFLFLAGVAVSLSAGSKFRRSGSTGVASRAVARRGLEVFGLAFLFRLQAWILGWSDPRNLLKVDILNIMGPSISAAGLLWGLARTTRARIAIFGVVTLAIAFLTPALRAAPVIRALPSPIEAYFRPLPGLTNFVFPPWAGFVFAGAILGLLIDGARTADSERRLNTGFAAAGAALGVGAFGLSYLPSPFGNSYFWTTSPAFFFLRAGIMTAVVAGGYFWTTRPSTPSSWRPLEQLGRTSLFIYWIHVEMVYGLISRPIHHRLPFPAVLMAFAVLTLLMLGCSVAWERRGTWRSRPPARGLTRQA
jgi:uncharacterized membrane protein